MLRFGALTWAERVAAVARHDRHAAHRAAPGAIALADVPFGEWLDEHRQPAALVEKLYDPLLTGALNEQSRRASASYAIQVFQDALLAHAAGYVVGAARLPARPTLRETPLPRRAARDAGERPAVRRRRAVTGVELAGGEVLAGRRGRAGDQPPRARQWVPEELAAARRALPA